MTLLTRRTLLAGIAAAPGWKSPPAAGGNKYLFLDSRVVERKEGVRLSLGTVRKDPHNPLFREDKPWEPRFDNLYANVLYDEREKRFKCWYSPFIQDEVVRTTPKEKRVGAYRPGKREMGVCYAVSRDGVAWTKPELGIVEVDGSGKNNIVARGPHGSGVFYDPRDPDAARRYKMFFKARQMAAKFSPDGQHWSADVEFPEIAARGDTHNNALWAPELNQYVGITRLWTGRERTVGRTESPDFVHWTKAEEVFRSLPEENIHRQTYAMPVFRYAGVYLGLVMMFNTDTDAVDCELAWSPDTVRWERVCAGTPLIPRGAQGSYDSGCIYAAVYPVAYRGELRLYYGGNNDTHGSWRDGFFCLARLRPDGFAGLEPAAAGTAGTILTRALRCSGPQLRLSADAAAGSVRVAILDHDRFRLDRCEPLRGDVTDAPVKWRGGPSLAQLEGREIRVQIELRSAKIYSLWA